MSQKYFALKREFGQAAPEMLDVTDYIEAAEFVAGKEGAFKSYAKQHPGNGFIVAASDEVDAQRILDKKALNVEKVVSWLPVL